MTAKKASAALISVFHKDGLEPIVKKLDELGVTLYSTGGTEKFIHDLGIDVVPVEDVTSYPSILGGRVKTLHPKVFGGILNRQDNESDVSQMKEFDIPQLDIVIVDLYPFEKTVASGASEQDIIEKIDIGGISLIRAAAKNFKDVLCVSSMEDYEDFLNVITAGNGTTTLEDRKRFATKAFNISSHYDTAIFNYFNQEKEETVLKISETKGQVLRYGENPHQKGFFFGDFDAMFTKLHGKELSYNNLLDVDAAVNLMGEFKNDDPTFAILKHNNACGLATRSTIKQAYVDALAGDPVSAFGGILISNVEIDKPTAEEIHNLFCEVVIAPSYSDEALEILKGKKNRIILIQNKIELPETLVRTCLNGVLVQDKDSKTDSKEDLNPVTDKKPTPQEIEDLIFASKLCKHTKSNTIVLAKNKQLCASGTGQTSRVDALNQAIHKAQSFNFDLEGAVMASDAFFPFPDCVEIADKAGIKSVIQPGGSIKDQLSIDYCNENGLAMVMTGTRHFKH
ncbi:MAG TPA: bifunctional phosphoribosylaminoimidazolecarboxamide formyltransferase/IMP cyclohydrolase PurH [Muricauda sp.]|uniref:Bifunctional purine biosynthesis protein PurH n=1 Tax=Flagellimonas aurea TaxID=2915619 RepID=A0ABS3G8H8_9FLAO|nr:bifunctional phosphoribosylaminoimidazolecarboxamide formyltransferase/IMP cyclohydrolase [Allomuricauda aurea]MAO17920.1 bifunctional phosphoribosylaminoimidazolecarboxamide formyltransferase/inosine monophosphate cyclohydrolase [Allomuricauda sp.]UBZ15308.1 bifunctional phosphoribosylaminoimidazolecarboxamide formyltransferase/IMP cyclohydrolase [Allomuricauda aquimarina]MBC73094.1 bifunctional phosphoribosylaminoimidazolecarboxamide formyltransferase/inosine monophosphate cyclohydrolase [A|tara:strand:- start:1086 stop:2615 length:1530 start_codon:yes stop_codon:yes gene_type:complete